MLQSKIRTHYRVSDSADLASWTAEFWRDGGESVVARATLPHFRDRNYTPPATTTESEVAQLFELFGLPACRRKKGLLASDVDQIRGWRRGVCFHPADCQIEPKWLGCGSDLRARL